MELHTFVRAMRVLRGLLPFTARIFFVRSNGDLCCSSVSQINMSRISLSEGIKTHAQPKYST